MFFFFSFFTGPLTRLINHSVHFRVYFFCWCFIYLYVVYVCEVRVQWGGGRRMRGMKSTRREGREGTQAKIYSPHFTRDITFHCGPANNRTLFSLCFKKTWLYLSNGLLFNEKKIIYKRSKGGITTFYLYRISLGWFISVDCGLCLQCRIRCDTLNRGSCWFPQPRLNDKTKNNKYNSENRTKKGTETHRTTMCVFGFGAPVCYIIVLFRREKLFAHFAKCWERVNSTVPMDTQRRTAAFAVKTFYEKLLRYWLLIRWRK